MGEGEGEADRFGGGGSLASSWRREDGRGDSLPSSWRRGGRGRVAVKLAAAAPA